MEVTSGMRLKEAPRRDRQMYLKSLKDNEQRDLGQAAERLLEDRLMRVVSLFLDVCCPYP